MPRYRGSCHCGRVAYEVEGEIDRVIECNCSICSRKGYLHWYVTRDQFRLLTSWNDLATYRFQTLTAAHHFCPVCGVAAFYIPRSDPDLIDVNLRCVEGIDLGSLDIESFDGENWDEAERAFRERDASEDGGEGG
jgi:hypothetical protein